MKKILLFICTFCFTLILSACQTNTFVNDPWQDPVEEPVEVQVDDPLEEPAEEPVEEPAEEPVDGPIDCSFAGGEPVQCPEDMMCGTVEWISSEPQVRCIPKDICNNNMCGTNSECVVLESYPVQVKCVPAQEQDEESADDPVVETVTVTAPEQEPGADAESEAEIIEPCGIEEPTCEE